MVDEGAVLLDGGRGVLGRGAEEELLGGELTGQTAAGARVCGGRRRDDVFVGGGQRGQRLLLLLEHAHEGQDLLAQALVLVDDAAEVLAQMAQLRLGRVDALVARLHDADDLGEVVLGGRGFLGGRVGGWTCVSTQYEGSLCNHMT